MRSLLTVILALVLSGQVQAQEPPKPDWEGVWKGTIGDLPVMACLQESPSGWARGSYYYLSQLKPIRLERDESGTWSEHPGWQEVTTGTWQFAQQDGGLAGEWQQQGKRLPIRLERVVIADKDNWAACGSDEFIAPRVRPLAVSRKAESRAGIAFTRISYKPPKWFDSVALESFAIPETRPGDRAINARLRLDVAHGDEELDYVSCMQGALGANGTDGDMEFGYSPDELGSGFLRVLTSSSSFCGGAHPNHNYYWLSFDRQSGKQIDLFRWFTAKGAPPQRFSAGDASMQVSPALRRLALRQLRFEDSECRDAVSNADYWFVGLAAKGMILTPSLPHVATACTDNALVSFAQLRPFLSKEGFAAIARLGLAKVSK